MRLIRVINAKFKGLKNIKKIDTQYNSVACGLSAVPGPTGIGPAPTCLDRRQFRGRCRLVPVPRKYRKKHCRVPRINLKFKIKKFDLSVVRDFKYGVFR